MSLSWPNWQLFSSQSVQSVSEGCFLDQNNLVFEVGCDHDINHYILPLSGSEWCFNNSYTCLKACVGLFLGLYKIIHFSSTVDAYASKWPVKLLRVSGHILRSILPNVIFDRVCYIGREFRFDIENANNITPCYGNPGKLGGESWHKSSYLPSGMFQ